MKRIKSAFMDFGNLFKDNNDINEKSIVGFIAFIVMIIFAFADLLTGYFGKDLVILHQSQLRHAQFHSLSDKSKQGLHLSHCRKESGC